MNVSVLKSFSLTKHESMSSDGPMIKTQTSGASCSFRRILTERDNQCLSFENCEDLLRGSPLGQILARAGQILSGSAGSAKTYRLSQAVTEIDAFISHNWAVRRLMKFVALAFEFNFNIAVGAMFFLALPLAFASARLPLPSGEGYSKHVLARLSVGPLFLCALLFARDLCCLRHRGPTVFVDKTCIAQDSLDKKLAGIAKLGAFLVKSKRMLILYSPMYLNRLWTVYELACFLSVHPASRLKILAVSQAMVYLVGVFIVWLWVSLGALTYAFTNESIVTNIFGFLAAAAVVISQRRWARDKAALFEAMASFDVRNCACAVASDRQAVYANIAGLMIAVFGFPLETDMDTALDNFNLLVRTDLPSAVKLSMGRFAFSYKHYVVLGATFAGSQALDEGSCLAAGANTACVASMLELTIWAFCLFPVLFCSLEFLSSQFLHLRGCRSAAWIAIATVLTTVEASVLHGSIKLFRDAAADSPTLLAGYGCFAATACLMTCLAGGSFGACRRRRCGAAAPAEAPARSLVAKSSAAAEESEGENPCPEDKHAEAAEAATEAAELAATLEVGNAGLVFDENEGQDLVLEKGPTEHV